MTPEEQWIAEIRNELIRRAAEGCYGEAILAELEQAQEKLASYAKVGQAAGQTMSTMLQAQSKLEARVRQLEAALTGLVGVSEPSELAAMRTVIAALPASVDDQTAMIAAIDVLLASAPTAGKEPK